MLNGGIFIVSLLFCLLSGAQTKRNVEKVLTVSNGEDWGNWGNVEYCKEGTYAAGYKMKYEEDQGKSDDSALNGIILVCKDLDGGSRNVISSDIGDWGDWSDEKFCENRDGQKQFLTSFKLKVEEYYYQLGRDNSAANLVAFTCRNFNDNGGSHTIEQDIDSWGDYGYWSYSCGQSSAICGIMTRVEDYVGSVWNQDDTSLNDVQFVCCQYYQ